MDRLTQPVNPLLWAESPYKRALLAYSQAASEGALLAYSAEHERFAIKGVSPGLRACIDALTGVALCGPEEAPGWLALAQAYPEQLRATPEPDGSVKVVHLASPTRRALARILSAPSQAVREVLATPVAALQGLPGPLTLHCERVPPEAAQRAYGALRVRFVVTTSRAAYEEAGRAGGCAFVLRELEAMAVAVEANRAHPRDLDQWLANKRKAPLWCVSPEATGALDVKAVTRATRSTWSVGSALDALGAELRDVDVKAGGL